VDVAVDAEDLVETVEETVEVSVVAEVVVVVALAAAMEVVAVVEVGHHPAKATGSVTGT
jgi:hypothetical protein